MKFGNSAGTQCSCNALFAICFSIIKKVSIWKSWDLDCILEHGDELFKSVGIPRALSMNELPNNVAVENNNIKIEMLENYNGLLGCNYLFPEHSHCDIGNGLIFTRAGYSFSLIWSKKSIFLFDSHSRDINGSFIDEGSCVALSFKKLNDVDQYIKTEYSKQLSNFREAQYELQYVRATTSSSGVLQISNAIKKRRNKIHCNIYGTQHDEIKKRKRKKRATLLGTPEHVEIKRRVCEKYSNIRGTTKHEQIKMRALARYNQQRTSTEMISKFRELVKEGPYYICAVCNRCHYHKSVLLFKVDKYMIDIDNFYHEVTSCDGRLYICHTCHTKLKKSEIPAQAVWNKLEFFLLPDDLANMNRRERAIISRRILFKKITIMPKGQAPKLKRSICNVPVNTAN